jgi:prophage regulatory protein
MSSNRVASATKILRKPTVIERVALSGTTIWRLERAGQFPKSIRLAPNRVGWRESDIEAWIAERAEVGHQ